MSHQGTICWNCGPNLPKLNFKKIHKADKRATKRFLERRSRRKEVQSVANKIYAMSEVRSTSSRYTGCALKRPKSDGKEIKNRTSHLAFFADVATKKTQSSCINHADPSTQHSVKKRRGRGKQTRRRIHPSNRVASFRRKKVATQPSMATRRSMDNRAVQQAPRSYYHAPMEYPDRSVYQRPCPELCPEKIDSDLARIYEAKRRLDLGESASSDEYDVPTEMYLSDLSLIRTLQPQMTVSTPSSSGDESAPSPARLYRVSSSPARSRRASSSERSSPSSERSSPSSSRSNSPRATRSSRRLASLRRNPRKTEMMRNVQLNDFVEPEPVKRQKPTSSIHAPLPKSERMKVGGLITTPQAKRRAGRIPMSDYPEGSRVIVKSKGDLSQQMAEKLEGYFGTEAVIHAAPIYPGTWFSLKLCDDEVIKVRSSAFRHVRSQEETSFEENQTDMLRHKIEPLPPRKPANTATEQSPLRLQPLMSSSHRISNLNQRVTFPPPGGSALHPQLPLQVLARQGTPTQAFRPWAPPPLPLPVTNRIAPPEPRRPRPPRHQHPHFPIHQFPLYPPLRRAFPRRQPLPPNRDHNPMRQMDENNSKLANGSILESTTRLDQKGGVQMMDMELKDLTEKRNDDREVKKES